MPDPDTSYVPTRRAILEPRNSVGGTKSRASSAIRTSLSHAIGSLDRRCERHRAASIRNRDALSSAFSPGRKNAICTTIRCAVTRRSPPLLRGQDEVSLGGSAGGLETGSGERVVDGSGPSRLDAAWIARYDRCTRVAAQGGAARLDVAVAGG